MDRLHKRLYLLLTPLAAIRMCGATERVLESGVVGSQLMEMKSWREVAEKSLVRRIQALPIFY